MDIIHSYPRSDYSPPLDWPGLCRIEPRLPLLEQSIRRGAHLGDMWRDYEGMKCRLKNLVGWDSRNPELRNHGAYDIAHAHLLDILEGGA